MIVLIIATALQIASMPPPPSSTAATMTTVLLHALSSVFCVCHIIFATSFFNAVLSLFLSGSRVRSHFFSLQPLVPNPESPVACPSCPRILFWWSLFLFVSRVCPPSQQEVLCHCSELSSHFVLVVPLPFAVSSLLPALVSLPFWFPSAVSSLLPALLPFLKSPVTGPSCPCILSWLSLFLSGSRVRSHLFFPHSVAAVPTCPGNFAILNLHRHCHICC
jgi:hypothetical protein